MLIVTLAVGFYFLITVPTGGEKVTILETRVAALQATNDLLSGRVTASTTPSPTIDSTLNAAVNDNFVATTSVETPTVDIPQPVAPVEAISGPRITSVQASTSVDSAGCAVNPATTFAAFDTIYGVAMLAEMQTGTSLAVSFTFGEQVVYEETFMIEVPGTFCRWYKIQPDAVGWEAGTYTISYTVNGAAPVTTSYTIE
ncbi:MAG: hypothetical protein K8I82_07985 [Anaerolineae bacterium]|nr:hypothetical protein [Anaerolineae bacterium]